LVFPKILENSESVWQEDKAVLVDGSLSDKDGVFKLLADSAKEINQDEIDHSKEWKLPQENRNGQNASTSKIIITFR